ncbi:unnamed protein product [Cyprideis torosa]|uniref:Uncharacterized protein n=1 Tax=Cyprideis torosa TaxID=163714 RepID=A0A7R8WCX1_9CRUS|nr:unnamed protein product [Cyprideis torosa]CAG0891402.1 unnamed protein product [Cyprideis torosa]
MQDFVGDSRRLKEDPGEKEPGDKTTRMTRETDEGRRDGTRVDREEKRRDDETREEEMCEDCESFADDLQAAAQVMASSANDESIPLLLRALYPFQAKNPRTLSFAKGDLFLLHSRKSLVNNWWLVVRVSDGIVGFVPHNYIEMVQNASVSSIKKYAEAVLSALSALMRKSKADRVAKLGLSPEEEDVYVTLQTFLSRSEKPRKPSLPPPPSVQPEPVQPEPDAPPPVPARQRPPPPSTFTTTATVTAPSLAVETDYSQTLTVSSDSSLSLSFQTEENHDPPQSDLQGLPPPENHLSAGEDDSTTATAKSVAMSSEGSGSSGGGRAPLPPPVDPSPPCQKPSDEDSRRLCRHLVDAVRGTSSLSHEVSRLVVVTVLDVLSSAGGPGWESLVTPLLEEAKQATTSQAGGSLWSEEDSRTSSRDAVRLRRVLRKLVDARNDEQQRSWHLHEDEGQICEFLDEAMEIMLGADPLITTQVISFEGYRYVLDLVSYYQMELRRRIRLKLLELMTLTCVLDPKVIPICINSVLPLELSRDILTNRTSPDPAKLKVSDWEKGCDVEEKAQRSLDLLSTLLSVADPLPCHYFDHMNATLFSYLLQLVEDEVDTLAAPSIPPPPQFDSSQSDSSSSTLDSQRNSLLVVDAEVLVSLPPPLVAVEEDVSHASYLVLLGLNLQFPSPLARNPVLESIQARRQCPALCEKLILSLNRCEEDPLQELTGGSSPLPGGQLRPTNSVVKMVTDLFSNQTTAFFFYTNDVNVILDIVIRNLKDIPADDERKPQFLKLLLNVLMHSQYEENLHKKQEIFEILKDCVGHERSSREVSDLATSVAQTHPELFANAVGTRCCVLCRTVFSPLLTPAHPMGSPLLLLHSPGTRAALSHQSQVSAALRSFIFAVHPDHFVQYPRERRTNEESLKELFAFLQILADRPPGHPFKLSRYLNFYLRDPNQRGLFKKVTISLEEVADVQTALTRVLRACDLSTDELPEYVAQPQSKARSSYPTSASEAEYRRQFYEAMAGFPGRQFSQEVAVENSLREFLEENLEKAMQRALACAPLQEEAERLRQWLVDSYGFSNLVWDSDWSASHMRGALQSFKTMAENNSEIMKNLRGHKVVFGLESGVSLEGHLMINPGEVQYLWAQAIRKFPDRLKNLHRIPQLEKALSRALRDVTVAQRRFKPRVMAQGYERDLRRLMTTVNDGIGRRGIPRNWPKSIHKIQLVVESGSGPLMLSPTGQIIVPSTVLSSHLFQFLSENMAEAEQLLVQYKKDRLLEEHLTSETTRELELASLVNHKLASPRLMIECCSNLLALAPDKKRLLRGMRVAVSTHFALSADGIMFLPYHWQW